MYHKIFNTLIATSVFVALFTVAASPAQAAAKCGASQSEVVNVEIPSTILSESIDAKVYLPACYNATNQKFPVLYLLHGMGNTADQWVNLGAPAAADQMSTQFIIVMPHDRMESSFNTAFINEVVPFIDENFRTLDDRNYRAIGGLSYGGGWAIHIGLSHPDLFSRIGGHSPALFIGDASALQFWAQHLPLGTLISIDIGNSDTMLDNSAEPIDALLTEAGVQHRFDIYAGGHTEEYWASHMTEYLHFYTTSW